jgi:aspartyl protease family protein
LTHRHLIGEILSWLATAAMLIIFAYNYPTIRRTIAQAVIPQGPTIKQSAAKPAAEDARSSEGVELRADRSGHFAANLEINGRPVDALVDTGATIVMLTYEDAERAGLQLRDRDFTMQMQTANGIAKAAPVTLDRISIGSITLRNVQAGVGEPGLLRTNLLGMSFLKRLSKFEIRSGTLVLQE